MDIFMKYHSSPMLNLRRMIAIFSLMTFCCRIASLRKRETKRSSIFRKIVIMNDIQQKRNKNPIYLQLQYNCFFHHYSFGSLALFYSSFAPVIEKEMCGLIKELYVFLSTSIKEHSKCLFLHNRKNH